MKNQAFWRVVVVAGMFLALVFSQAFSQSSAGKKPTGLNWEELSLPSSIKKVVCYENTAYAMGDNTLFISADNGSVWQPTPLGLGEVRLTALDVDNGSIWVGYIVGSYNYGVAVSSDGGATFIQSLWAPDRCVGLDFENGYGWAAIASWGIKSGALQKSPDADWVRHGYFSYGMVDVVTDSLDPANCAYIFLGQAGGYGGTLSWSTSDSGATWKDIKPRVIGSSVLNGVSTIYTFKQYSQNAGKTWRPLGVSAQTIAEGTNGLLYVGTAGKGVFGGKPKAWAKLGLKGESIISIGATSEAVFACSQEGKIFRAGLTP